MITELVLGTIVGTNVAMTRYVYLKTDVTARRMLAITIIWLAPVVGAIGVWKLLTPSAQPSLSLPSDYVLPPEFEQSGPAATIEASNVDAFVIANHLAFVKRVPTLAWDAMFDWANSLHDKEQTQRAIVAAQRAWLLHLRQALGATFHLYTTDQVWVLSSLYPRNSKTIAKYTQLTRNRLQDKLVHLAQFESWQPSIVIVVDDDDMYYEYISTYYPDDGEFSFSGGMFLNMGCPHLVIKASALDHLEPVIVHEMTHGSLSHLPLPKWLNEGIAVSTEHSVTGFRAPNTSAKARHSDHLDTWTPEAIQHFWAGSAFDSPGGIQQLAYDLANILVMQLGSDWNTFVQFASTASADDGGMQAANQVYSLDLGDLVCQILGHEPSHEWSPNPALWKAAS